jgi:hypothetical protein
MAGDIEAFLKMAAERRRQAQGGPVQGRQGPAPQPPQPASRSAPEPERRPLASTLKPSIHDAEILDAVLDESPAPYQPSSSVSQVKRPQKQKGKTRSKTPSAPVATNAPVLKPSVTPSIAQPMHASDFPAAGSPAPATDKGSALRVVDMLKNPTSISSAFILTEILKPLDLDRED